MLGTVQEEPRHPRRAKRLDRLGGRCGRQEDEDLRGRVRRAAQRRERRAARRDDADGSSTVRSREADRGVDVRLEVLRAVVRAAVPAEVERDRRPPLRGDRPLERAPRVDVLAEVVDEHVPLVAARPALAAQDDAAGALDLDRASLHGGQYPGAEPG